MPHRFGRASRRRRLGRGRRRPLKRLTRFRKKRFTLSKRIRKLERSIEMKTKDFAPAVNPIVAKTDFSYLTQYLGAIEVGTSDSQRIGNKIMVHNFQIRGEVIIPTADAAFDHHIKMIVVRDKANQGVAPIWDDVYTAGLPKIWPRTYRVVKNLSRFDIIATKTIHFKNWTGQEPSPGTTKEEQARSFTMFVKPRGNTGTLIFQDTSKDPSAATNGSFWWLAASTGRTSQLFGECATINLATRVRYSDP